VSGQKPREIAALVLQRRRTGEFTENLLERALETAEMSGADRSLCQELVYGVVRWQATLDWLIERRTDGRLQKPALQNVLRLGLYQIFWLDRIPAHAAVYESVQMARQAGFGTQAGFVNALLRGYLREAAITREALDELKQSRPHIGWSHPEWLVSRWQRRWGGEKTAELLEWNNTPPKTFARVNTLKTDPGRLLTQWRDEGVDYDFVRRDWFAESTVFELTSHPPLMSLASFRDGLFYVQDPGTLLAANELAPKPDENILDFCAAPGGKTTYLAQLVHNKAQIVASDVSHERLKLIVENCVRLGVTCVETVSAARLSRSGIARFDSILVDVPCSNTGVLRRRVDLRWRVQPDEIERLRLKQLQLLRDAACLLKRGGVLIYSTCSLEPEENAGVIKQFLDNSAGFTLERERTLLPFIDGVDGAYVARLARKE
jgi:16S rRNA (cytosine967-C5)-methyltransferase